MRFGPDENCLSKLARRFGARAEVDHMKLTSFHEQLVGRQLGSSRSDAELRRAVKAALKSRKRRRVLPFGDLVASQPALANHVLLGFTLEGGHLVSLHKEDADDQLDELEELSDALGIPADPVAAFVLHWWGLPASGMQLRHVHALQAFKGHSASGDYTVHVAETPDRSSAVVHGWKYSRDIDLESPCCVSVCPNPAMCESQPPTALTLVYSKLLGTQVVPLPLALTIPAHLILSTGCYMVVVCFKTPHAQRYRLPCRQPWLKNCLQWFGSGDGRKESCLERLQAYMFGESGPLHPILECEQGSRTSDRGGGGSCEVGGAVCVGQQVLDIELWLAEVLRGPISRQQLQQYFLSDYTVHVSSVCPHTETVDLVLLALVSSWVDGRTVGYQLRHRAVWDIARGQLTAQGQTFTKCPPPAPGKKLKLPSPSPGMQGEEGVLTNEPVLRGQSLRRLDHPFLPLTVTFSPLLI